MNDFCLWVDKHSRSYTDSMFGTKEGYAKCSNVVSSKDIEGAKLFLVSCYDLHEDGYCVFATENGVDDSAPDFGAYMKYKIIADVQFRGNSEYGNKYGNEYAGEETFNGITSLSDFEKLKENRYHFIEN